ncbi:hypothetical protein BJY01DRAFT_254251 [Aspergillus pseudoustus]|uniref:Uncharacterized protein n=1 Tax=Aspergillus pseudoustus TaxID=1810923 RepID=A0ABR4IWD1_9EURO
MGSLSRKEKFLVELGPLGIRISVRPIHTPAPFIPDAAGPVTTLASSLKTLDNLKFSAFVDAFSEIDANHYYTFHFTLFEKRPLVMKIGRAVIVLLPLGVQIGFSLLLLYDKP